MIRQHYADSVSSVLSKEDNKTIRAAIIGLIKFFLQKEVNAKEVYGGNKCGETWLERAKEACLMEKGLLVVVEEGLLGVEEVGLLVVEEEGILVVEEEGLLGVEEEEMVIKCSRMLQTFNS